MKIRSLVLAWFVVAWFGYAACGRAPDGRSGGTPGASGESGPPGFDRTVSLQGITFHVASTTGSSLNELTITPSGLEIDNTPIVTAIDGTVTNVEVSDLDRDNSPEVWVYVNSAGSGSYGSVVAYAANIRKSLSQIALPPVAENPRAGKGYMGHDRFAVADGAFTQRFPVYRAGDPNAAPTGPVRELRYTLARGEAGWVLKLDRWLEVPAAAKPGGAPAPPPIRATYDCQGGEAPVLTAAFYSDGDRRYAVLTLGREEVMADSAPSGSGARYVAGDYVEFWEHQGEAAVTWFGTSITCTVRR